MRTGICGMPACVACGAHVLDICEMSTSARLRGSEVLVGICAMPTGRGRHLRDGRLCWPAWQRGVGGRLRDACQDEVCMACAVMPRQPSDARICVMRYI